MSDQLFTHIFHSVGKEAFLAMLSFLQPRCIAGVEEVVDGEYRRSFSLANHQGWFSLKPVNQGLVLQVKTKNPEVLDELLPCLRVCFDMDIPLGDVEAALSQEQRFQTQLLERGIPRLPVVFTPFEAAVRAILGQQVTVAAATTLAGRLVERAGLLLETPQGGIFRIFPDAAVLRKTNLDGLGILPQRQQTLYGLAQAVCEDAQFFSFHQTYEEFHRKITALKGVGDWTAEYVAMRGLGMKDRFPAGDLGVLKALGEAGQRATPSQARSVAEAWRPYRTYGTLCLWREGGNA
ncbi:MAG: hypothetical protein MI717_01695 [Spirochaetales bacterium]|nr:hypothetical protein [Spirochaetales bacterium]